MSGQQGFSGSGGEWHQHGGRQHGGSTGGFGGEGAGQNVTNDRRNMDWGRVGARNAARSSGGEEDENLLELNRYIDAHDAELRQTRLELQNERKEREAMGKTLDRLRGVFAPEQQQRAPHEERVGRWNQMYDQIVQAGIEAERTGQKMPLTIGTATEMLENLVRQEQLNAELMSHLKRQDDSIKQLQSPRHHQDQLAFATIDSQLNAALETVYGRDPSYSQVRGQQMQAISQQLANEIRDLWEEDPQAWVRMTQQPQSLRKMVVHFVEQNIPPMARNLMNEQLEAQTPLTDQDLYEAIEEAKYIEDPELQESIHTKLREELLMRKFSKGNPNIRRRNNY